MSEQIKSQAAQSVEAVFAYIEAHPTVRVDFVDGELVEVSPKPIHGRLQMALGAFLVNWLEKHTVGVLHSEVLHVLDGQHFIPDISLNPEPADDADYFDVPPLLAIEIRSDSQSRAAQRRKAQAYIAQGTPAVLLVFPGEWMELFTAGDDPVTFKPGTVVKNIPGLDGLEIAVSDFII